MNLEQEVTVTPSSKLANEASDLQSRASECGLRNGICSIFERGGNSLMLMELAGEVRLLCFGSFFGDLGLQFGCEFPSKMAFLS